MRKLPRFSNDLEANVEWPTAEDILKMPRDEPYELSEIRWQEDEPKNCLIKVINCIGLSFTNGVQSPLLGH